MTKALIVRSKIVAVFLAAIMFAIACGGTSDTTVDTSLEPADSVDTATQDPSEVVAVNATPLAAASSDSTASTPSPSSSAMTANDTQPLSVGDALILVPAEWTLVRSADDLSTFLEQGRSAGVLGELSADTVSEWKTLIAQDQVALALDATATRNASIVISAVQSSVNPTTDPQGWITAVQAALTRADGSVSYAGTPASHGDLNGVRSVVTVIADQIERRIEQFTVANDGTIITITVSGFSEPDRAQTDELFASFQALSP